MTWEMMGQGIQTVYAISLFCFIVLELILVLDSFYDSWKKIPVPIVLGLLVGNVWLLSMICERNDYGADTFVEQLSFIYYGIWWIIQGIATVYCGYQISKRKQKQAGPGAVKEALDNLPTPVCFFNEQGKLIMCNRQMLQFVYSLTEKDLQWREDMEDMMAQREWVFSKEELSVLDQEAAEAFGQAFWGKDRRIWKMEYAVLSMDDGQIIHQYLAVELTKLYETYKSLEQDNQRLEGLGQIMRENIKNVATIAREEEMLNLKMRVHDDLGNCLISTRQMLRKQEAIEYNSPIVYLWNKAVGLLKRDGEEENEIEVYQQLKKLAKDLGIQFDLQGALPREQELAYAVVCGFRESITNTLRHGNGDAITIKVQEQEKWYRVDIKDNGHGVRGALLEGGGLSTLRKRVERLGGLMELEGKPSFTIILTLPKEGYVHMEEIK